LRKSVLVVCLCCLLALVVSAGTTYAASVSYSQTIAAEKTDWAKVIQLDKFDSSLGTLTSIVFDLEATITATVGVENLASKDASVDILFGSLVDVKKGATSLLNTTPTYSATYSLAAYDTVFDWGGTSGAKYLGLTDTETKTITLNSGFGDYIGAGTFDLDVLASAFSKTTGTGNIASYYETEAGATAMVTYNYDVVPEPASLVALATGLMGAFGFGLRRKLH